jgi:predicted sugar kinase
MKSDFKKYPVGTLFNSVNVDKKPCLGSDEVKIKYPARLNAMAIDPGLITSNKNLVYTPGEVVISIDIMTSVHVKILKESSDVIVSQNTKRDSLVRHAAALMKKILRTKEGLWIEVNNEKEIKHAGLGSSSGIIAGVCTAINELYGQPIAHTNLIKFCAQNHGEEIDSDPGHLSPVQCIGGSAASMLTDEGVLLLAGESTVVGGMSLGDNYKVSIAIPNDYKPKDADELMKLEEENFDKFLQTGKKHSREIAYRILHNVLPTMKSSSIDELGNLVYDYRFFMGSIDNCSFVFDRMKDIKGELISKMIFKKGSILGLSSVGPAFFQISKNNADFDSLMESMNMKILKAKVYNSKYLRTD